ELDAATFATVAKSWAVMADPDAADRAWREAGDKEELFISPTMGGYYVQGQIDEANGRLIEQALAAVMGRRAEGDERAPAQRRAAAFVSIMAESLSSGRTQPSARIPRQLSIHVPYDTLQGLIAACPPARPRDPNSHPSGTPQTSDSGEHRAGREGAAFGGTAAGNGTTAPNHGSAGNGAASPNGAA